MKHGIQFLLFTTFILSPGCKGQPVTFPALPAGRNIDATTAKAVESSSCGYQIMFFLPIDLNERHTRAFNRLQRSAPDSYITDVEIQETWTYLLVGTQYCTQMRAKAYSLLPATANSTGP